MENQRINNLCQQNLNRLIATCLNSMTCLMRFDGCLLSNLHKFQTSLIPFPSLKLVTFY